MFDGRCRKAVLVRRLQQLFVLCVFVDGIAGCHQLPCELLFREEWLAVALSFDVFTYLVRDALTIAVFEGFRSDASEAEIPGLPVIEGDMEHRVLLPVRFHPGPIVLETAAAIQGGGFVSGHENLLAVDLISCVEPDVCLPLDFGLLLVKREGCVDLHDP